MQVISLIWGILALVFMLVGLVPLLGALNWLNILFAGVGMIFSIFAYVIKAEGSRRGAIAGLICCIVAIVVGILRLILGGGIL